MIIRPEVLFDKRRDIIDLVYSTELVPYKTCIINTAKDHEGE